MNTPTLRAALRYAERGVACLPVEPRGKRPHAMLGGVGGFHLASTDPGTLRAWFTRDPDANIGVVPPATLVVLDTDSEAAERVVRSLGCLEVPTPTVKTGRGFHRWFRLPGDLPLSKRDVRVVSEDGEHVTLELKGTGGYLMAPPSVHPSGAAYAWIHRGSFAPLPEALAALLRAPLRAPPSPRDHCSPRDHFAGEIALAREALDRLAPWRADDYATWLAVGMALHAADASLLGAWDDWSTRSARYESDACSRKWRTFRGGGVGLGSLLHWAEEDSPGWRRPSPHGMTHYSDAARRASRVSASWGVPRAA